MVPVQRHPDVHNEPVIHLPSLALAQAWRHLGPVLHIDPAVGRHPRVDFLPFCLGHAHQTVSPIHRHPQTSTDDCNNHFRLTVSNHFEDRHDYPGDRDFTHIFYVSPAMRAPPYLLGILLGYLLYRTDDKPVKIAKVLPAVNK